MVTLLALLLLLGATAALFFVLRQAQIARLAEATVTARLQAREAELANLQQQLTSLHSLREENASLKTRLTLELQQFEQKQTLLNDSKEQLSVAFKNIANEIFEDKSKKFASTSKESLAMVLNPLQEKILSFEKKVEETYQKESNERFSLAKEIKNLQELKLIWILDIMKGLQI